MPGGLVHSHLEDHGGNDKQGKHHHLDYQTSNNKILPQTRIASSGHQSPSSTLDQEWEDVPHDKDLGQPVHSDDRILFRVNAADDTAQCHVNGGCEQGRSQEDEHVLDAVGHQAGCLVVGGRMLKHQNLLLRLGCMSTSTITIATRNATYITRQRQKRDRTGSASSLFSRNERRLSLGREWGRWRLLPMKEHIARGSSLLRMAVIRPC